MEALVEFVSNQGGWGAWFLTVTGALYFLFKGKVILIREHETRLFDTQKHYENRLGDYRERLDAEIRENEWLRDALLSSTEMGAILTKSKTALSGRRHDDAS